MQEGLPELNVSMFSALAHSDSGPRIVAWAQLIR